MSLFSFINDINKFFPTPRLLKLTKFIKVYFDPSRLLGT